MDFNGTDNYISLGNNILDTSGDSFTMSAWIKSNKTTRQTIISEYQNGVCGEFTFWLDISTGIPVFHDGSGLYSYGNTSVNDGQWHYVTFVSDISNSYIYVDGKLDALNSDVNWQNHSSSVDVRIGSTVSGDYFNGLIDDVRIYNYARNQEQIMQDYNAGLSTYFK